MPMSFSHSQNPCRNQSYVPRDFRMKKTFFSNKSPNNDILRLSQSLHLASRLL